MKFPLPLALALLAAPAASPAQTAQQPPAADPAAPVPAPVYESVLSTTPRGVEQGRRDWPGANAEVGQFRRGHSDILKAEEAAPAAPEPSRPPAMDHGHRHHGGRP